MNSTGTKAFVQICAVTALLIPKVLMAASPAAAAAPAKSNLSPEAQKESDWVDARWNQTEVGPFLASSLSIAGAPIAKGLSIKIGDTAEGTVCYDTASAAWRAA
ncbi:MAG TPA: hypothetical protein VJS65_17000, partial [Verrucomicrobiae bacterium]|nr:hypothetical protein [Verrucomicrobiae bacterium]